jgi:hypothetical protein
MTSPPRVAEAAPSRPVGPAHGPGGRDPLDTEFCRALEREVLGPISTH